MFKRSRNEIFSFRKYKGYGLASVVVGLMFLTTSVRAEDIATTNSSSSENNTVRRATSVENASTDTSSEILKPNTTTPPSNDESNSGSNVHVVSKISKVVNDQLEHKGDVVKPNQPGITISKTDDGIADENAHVMFKKPDENASAEELWNIVQNMPDDFQNNERSYLRNLERLGDELNLQPGEIKELNNLGGWHAIDKEGNAGKFAIGKKNEQGYFTGWYIDKDGKRQEGGMLGSDALDNLYVHEQGLDRRFEYILMLAKSRTRANRNDVTTDGSDYEPRTNWERAGLSREDYRKLSNSEKDKVNKYSPAVEGYNGIEKTFSAFSTEFGSRIKLDFATGHLSELNGYKGGYRIVVKARNKAGAETKVYDKTIRDAGSIIQNDELIDKGLDYRTLEESISSDFFKDELTYRRNKIYHEKIKNSVLKDKKRLDYTDEDKQLRAELFEQALAEAKELGDITLPIDKDFLSIANARKTDSAWHKSFHSTPVSLATTLNIEMKKTLTDDTVDSDTPMWRSSNDPKSKADDRLYKLFQTLIPGVKSIVYHVKDDQLEVVTDKYSYKAASNGSKEIGIQGSDIEGTAGADTYHLTDESYEIVRTNTGLNNHYNGWARLIKHDSQTNNDVVNEDFAHFGYMIGVDKGILRTNVRSDNELSEKITAAIGGDMDKLGKAGYFSTGDIHLDKDVISYTVQVSVADNNSVGVNTQSPRLTYNVPLLADFSVIQDTVEPSRSVVERIVPKLTIPQKEKDKIIEEIKKKKKTSEFTELISGNVKVRYADENGKLLSLKDDTGIGEKESDGTYITNKRQLIGTSYDVTDKKLSSMTTIDGKYYKFKEASADSATLTGDVIREGRTVTLVYKESDAPTTATVTANYYKDGTTEKLADSVVKTDALIGSEYTTDAKTIEGKTTTEDKEDRVITRKTTYTLVATPANATGTVPEDGVTVNYYYTENVTVNEVKKQATVVANYYKDGTTEKLADSADQGKKDIGSAYTTEPAVIEPKVEKIIENGNVITRTTTYELMKVPEDKEGIVPVGGKVVNYYYRESVEEIAKPNDAPKVDIPKYNEPIDTVPDDAPKVEIPEYNGPIDTSGDPEVHEKPEFDGSVVPLDPPVVKIPEYKDPIGAVPNDSPKVEIPEFDGGVSGIPEVHEKPEFKDGVVPNDAQKVEIPEYKEPIGVAGIPEVHEKPEFKGVTVPNDVPIQDKPSDKPNIPENRHQQPLHMDETPVSPRPVETPSVQESVVIKPVYNVEKLTSAKEAMLPNTAGGDDTSLSALGLLTSSFTLALVFRKRKED